MVLSSFTIMLNGLIGIIMLFVVSNILFHDKNTSFIAYILCSIGLIVYTVWASIIIPIEYSHLASLYRSEISDLSFSLMLFGVIIGWYSHVVTKDEFLFGFIGVCIVLAMPIFILSDLGGKPMFFSDYTTLIEYIDFVNILTVLVSCLCCLVVGIAIFSLFNEKNNFIDKSEGSKILLKAVVVIIISFSMIYYIYGMIDYAQYASFVKGLLDNPNYHFTFNTAPSVMYSDNMFFLKHIINSVYFSLTTFTTVGFGDVVPNSTLTRFIVGLEVVSMFFVIYLGLNIHLTSNKE